MPRRRSLDGGALAAAKEKRRLAAIAAAKEKARLARENASGAATTAPPSGTGPSTEGGTFTLGSASLDESARRWLPWAIGAGLLFLMFRKR
jgi:hypothetical protein